MSLPSDYINGSPLLTASMYPENENETNQTNQQTIPESIYIEPYDRSTNSPVILPKAIFDWPKEYNPNWSEDNKFQVQNEIKTIPVFINTQPLQSIHRNRNHPKYHNRNRYNLRPRNTQIKEENKSRKAVWKTVQIPWKV